MQLDVVIACSPSLVLYVSLVVRLVSGFDLAAWLAAGVVLKYGFARYGAALPKEWSVGVLIVICVYIAGFAWSWGPIGWLYPA